MPFLRPACFSHTLRGLSAVVALLLCAAAPPRLEPCHVAGVIDQGRCAVLDLPLEWAAPEAATIGIHVAVLPASGGAREPDPVFVLTGGPGQAASELGPVLGHVFGPVRRKREIVLVDMRGTGLSAPMACDVPEEVQAGFAEWRAAQTCPPGDWPDPAAFTSANFIRDLEAVRAALGYERINLWGASYGTRAALLYARAYPHRVRSMVLDGTLPPARKLFEQEFRSAQAALDAVLDACAADAACRSAFPGIRATLAHILEELAGVPRTVRAPDFPRGEVRIDRDAFVQNLRGALYRPLSAAAVPYIIDQFARNNPGPLLAFATETNRRIADTLYLGLTLSVLCTEEVSRTSGPGVARAAKSTVFADSYFRFWKTACEDWPRGKLAPDFDAPVAVTAPVLLLSGALDPITPPEAGAETMRRLSNSRHIVAAAAGHGVSAEGCSPDLIAEFIESADPNAVDASCLDRLDRPPFVTGLYGPEP